MVLPSTMLFILIRREKKFTVSHTEMFRSLERRGEGALVMKILHLEDICRG